MKKLQAIDLLDHVHDCLYSMYVATISCKQIELFATATLAAREMLHAKLSKVIYPNFTCKVRGGFGDLIVESCNCYKEAS